MKDKTIIRKVELQDIPEIFKFVKELATFEKAPKEVTINEKEYLKLYQSKLWDGCVAQYESQIIGMIIWYDKFSTWKGKYLYIEDFIVTQSFRSQGIGKLLFDYSLDFAKQKEYKGIWWQVLDWNTSAIKFYKKYNCILDNEWINGKIHF